MVLWLQKSGALYYFTQSETTLYKCYVLNKGQVCVLNYDTRQVNKRKNME